MKPTYGQLANEADDAYYEARRLFRGLDGGADDEERAAVITAFASSLTALTVAQQAEDAERRR